MREAGDESVDGALVGAADRAQRFAEWARPALLAMTRLAQRLAPAAGPADVDDVVQEALLRAWQKWHLFDAERGTATTWLLAITADRARAARRNRVRALRVVDDTADAADLPDQHPAGRGSAHPAGAYDTALDTDLDLDRAIANLPERQRMAVHLHYFLDLSIADTAAVMDCAPGTVKSTLHDARRALRLALETEPGTDDEH